MKFAGRTNWPLFPNRLSEALARQRASGRPLLDLTASNPTACGFRYERDAILQALAAPAALEYHPDPRGLVLARDAVVDYYTRLGAHIHVDDILLTASTSEAYSFIFRLLCDPGDEVLIPAPSYPLLGLLADILNINLVRYPLFYDHGWQIDLAALESLSSSRTRAIVVIHPNNPTGHYAKPFERARLAAICAARDLALIADEVFLDFSFTGEAPATFAGDGGNAAALTFILSGLSKISGLPQMKLAWLIARGPENYKQPALARLELIADTYLSVSTPVQNAAPLFFDQRHSFQSQLLSRVRKNIAELDSQLGSQNACNRLALEGGWYAVLRIPTVRSDEDFALELLNDKDVLVHPGHFYDFAGEGYLVISLITPERDFAAAIGRLLSLF